MKIFVNCSFFINNCQANKSLALNLDRRAGNENEIQVTKPRAYLQIEIPVNGPLIFMSNDTAQQRPTLQVK
jgi:hypothetical protein